VRLFAGGNMRLDTHKIDLPTYWQNFIPTNKSLWRISFALIVVLTLFGATFTNPNPGSTEAFSADTDQLVGSSLDLASDLMIARDQTTASRAVNTSFAATADMYEAAAPYQPVATEDLPATPEPATRVSEEGLQKLKDWEGFSLRGYLLGDGKCTIGWGHAVPVAQRPNCRNWVITEEEAREKFRVNVAFFEDAVNNFFTRDFNQNQFDAVVSFAFNVGQVWYRWQWPTDPDDAFFNRVLPKYIYPVQFRTGLMRRRNAEVELFNTPVAS
jgi:GH24 family phage-related lysozyme (muramidase)